MGDYAEKEKRCFISVTLKSWSGRNLLEPTTYVIRGRSSVVTGLWMSSQNMSFFSSSTLSWICWYSNRSAKTKQQEVDVVSSPAPAAELISPLIISAEFVILYQRINQERSFNFFDPNIFSWSCHFFMLAPCGRNAVLKNGIQATNTSCESGTPFLQIANPIRRYLWY